MEPRAAALIHSSLVDNLLEYAIRFNFVEMGKDKFNALFRNPTAPLASFSAKIMIGHPLGIYGSDFKSQLDRFRSICNTFAHAILPIGFDDSTIAEECNKLDPNRLVHGQYNPQSDNPRARFTVTGVLTATHIMRYNKIWQEACVQVNSSCENHFPINSDNPFFRRPRNQS